MWTSASNNRPTIATHNIIKEAELVEMLSSRAVCQNVDNVKHSKLSLRNDTMLQDLPIKLLECILVKVVVVEVESMRLAKSVWKEKADLVISRLQTVSSQWSEILTTDKFINEVHRTLDGTAPKTIRLEILHQRSIPVNAIKVITMSDEMFVLCRPYDDDHVINVYNRRHVAEAKDFIWLQGIRPMSMAGCRRSNSLYILHVVTHRGNMELSVLRIAREADNLFQTHAWVYTGMSKFAEMSVSANGNVLVLAKVPHCSIVSIFDVYGSKQHEIVLSLPIHRFSYAFNAFEKPDGNILLVAANYQCETMVLEIDTNGTAVRQYQSSSLTGYSVGLFVDILGRVLLTDWRNGIELLDSELNLLEFTGPRPTQQQLVFAYDMHYDRARNEIVRIDDTTDPNVTVLTTLRFVEE